MMLLADEKASFLVFWYPCVHEVKKPKLVAIIVARTKCVASLCFQGIPFCISLMKNLINLFSRKSRPNVVYLKKWQLGKQNDQEPGQNCCIQSSIFTQSTYYSSRVSEKTKVRVLYVINTAVQWKFRDPLFFFYSNNGRECVYFLVNTIRSFFSCIQINR